MDTLLLIDGSNLLFQMFYGMPSRIFNKDGKAIHGTLGFVGALLKIIRKTCPTHVAVLFDGAHHNERKDVDENYKANRPDYSQMAEEETPFSQLPDIYRALDYLQIRYTETTVCETDDVLAAYALTYGKQMQVIISSFDSDFFQLINDNVRVLRYRGDKTQICDAQYVTEKLGVTPALYADYKCLVGDTADNVKGVAGIGPKTAAKLINEYGSLANILDKIDEIKQAGMRSSLKDARERLQINQRLICLNGSACIPFALDELRFIDRGQTTNSVLSAIQLR